ncbi:hypothetical protein CMUS01_00769 [Colletotrichum musicola]|uniref:Uncharacterized protein n=1 Tax=Colletotrichum musicola TaxID=2175873 RepID=A0A8H6NY65_9PEZI|nr:hypothetical protein CMUS01_00769 [Colletotrichum musicola]
MKTSTVILALAGAALANPVAVPEKAERDLERRILNLVPAIGGGSTSFPIPQIPLVPGVGSTPLPLANLVPALTALGQSLLAVATNILAGLPLTGGLGGNGLSLPGVGSFPAIPGLTPVNPTIPSGGISPEELIVLIEALKNQLGNFTNLARNLPKGSILGGGPTATQLTTLTNAVGQIKAVVDPIVAPVTGAIPLAGAVGGVSTANLPGLPAVQGLVAGLPIIGDLLNGLIAIITGLLGGGLLGGR